MKTTYTTGAPGVQGTRTVTVIGLPTPMDRRLKAQNALRTWAQCKRPGHWRKPVKGCEDCPRYDATSTPELDGTRAGASVASAAPLFEFLDRRWRLNQYDVSVVLLADAIGVQPHNAT